MNKSRYPAAKSSDIHIFELMIKIVSLYLGLGEIIEYLEFVYGIILAVRRFATMDNLRSALLALAIYLATTKIPLPPPSALTGVRSIGTATTLYVLPATQSYIARLTIGDN